MLHSHGTRIQENWREKHQVIYPESCISLVFSSEIEVLGEKLNSYQFIMVEVEASQFNVMIEIIYIFSLIPLDPLAPFH